MPVNGCLNYGKGTAPGGQNDKQEPTDRPSPRILGRLDLRPGAGVSPYVASIMGSLREHGLDVLRHQLAARRLAAKSGRPSRDTLLAQEEAAVRQAERMRNTTEPSRS